MSSCSVHSTGSADAQIDRAAFSQQPEVLCPEGGSAAECSSHQENESPTGRGSVKKVSLCLVA